jgi:hypothetical protein
MQLVDEGSLALTLEAVNEALFLGRRISRSARVRAATWIAKRQGLPGSYADMFAPTQQDFADARLFTVSPPDTYSVRRESALWSCSM